MTIERPITEDDLHAYVDAGLQPPRFRCIVGDDRASRSSGTQATRRNVQGTCA